MSTSPPPGTPRLLPDPHGPAEPPAGTPRGLREAVALEYGLHDAPVLSVRARGEAALRVLEAARRHGIHVARDPQLLALLSRLEPDDAIPPELYRAVAVILAWAYWLKGMVPGDEKAQRPQPSAGAGGSSVDQPGAAPAQA